VKKSDLKGFHRSFMAIITNLFLSTGFCCKANYLDDDYEQILGRSHSAHGHLWTCQGMI